MVTIPPDWEAYARLQDKVARSSKVDNRIEALEAAMNTMLDEDNRLDDKAASTAAKTAARRERYRADLRQRYLPHNEPETNPIPDIEARSLSNQIKKVFRPDDWSIAAAVGAGHSHDQIASLFDSSRGAIDVRIFGMRRNAKAALTPQLLAELNELLAA